ncbi:hypothetical protein QR680_014561 [Steinernema hermaphroditum]|uniref:Uncharacterized protein n=1 Tax=Steinernema hermaphroditum TaxID=289476 RepID=A0AA39M4G1_9BILA|nr:hypothetical protein QR680_014561 [Steinernema hermaphroditum]
MSLVSTVFAFFFSASVVVAQFGYDYNPYMGYGGYGMGAYGGMYNPLMYPQNAAIGYGGMMNPYMGGYGGFMNPMANNFYSNMFASNYGNSGNSGYNKNNGLFNRRLSSNSLNQGVQSGSSIGSCRTPLCLERAKAKAKN